MQRGQLHSSQVSTEEADIKTPGENMDWQSHETYWPDQLHLGALFEERNAAQIWPAVEAELPCPGLVQASKNCLLAHVLNSKKKYNIDI